MRAYVIAFITTVCCIASVSANDPGNSSPAPAENGESAASIESLQYWWDDKHQEAVTMAFPADEFTLSASALPVGLHSLSYRVKDSNGKWSGLKIHYFYKGEKTDSARIVSYSYWWNDLTDRITTKQLAKPAVTLSIDETLKIPEEAKTSYAGHYTARLNIVVTDNHGIRTYLTTEVAYPDNDAPQTDINADNYVASSSVTLTWTEKTGDKMGDYNVYFSKDNGPFLLWLPDTQKTSATFRGEKGSKYLFTVTARDSYGNREAYDETKTVSVTFE